MKCEKCDAPENVREVLIWGKGGWSEKSTMLCKPCRKKNVLKYVK